MLSGTGEALNKLCNVTCYLQC